MRRFLLITAFITLPAWPAVIITSGSVFDHDLGNSGVTGIWDIAFAGTNFSISGGNSGPTSNILHNSLNNCTYATATCTFNFTQSTVGATAGPADNLAHFTYNGTDYSFTGLTPNHIDFSLNFVGPSLSASAVACFNDNNGKYCTAPAFGPVAFTMTGSFTIYDGPRNTILASDTISGSGLATTDGAVGSGEGTVHYTFADASVPEPASMTLIATGLALTGWLARRKTRRLTSR